MLECSSPPNIAICFNVFIHFLVTCLHSWNFLWTCLNSPVLGPCWACTCLLKKQMQTLRRKCDFVPLPTQWMVVDCSTQLSLVFHMTDVMPSLYVGHRKKIIELNFYAVLVLPCQPAGLQSCVYSLISSLGLWPADEEVSTSSWKTGIKRKVSLVQTLSDICALCFWTMHFGGSLKDPTGCLAFRLFCTKTNLCFSKFYLLWTFLSDCVFACISKWNQMSRVLKKQLSL